MNVSGDIDSLYTKTVDGDIIVTDSMYLSSEPMFYMNSISAYNGDFHTPDDVFYIEDIGYYERNGGYLYLQDV